VITEQELEFALKLKSELKELKIVIAKLEDVTISKTQSINGGISIDNTKITVDDHTKGILVTFKEDILTAHRMKLIELQDKFKEIIESPSDTLRRILDEDNG